MLEGKEVEGKIGEAGVYSVDVDAKGFFEVKAGAGGPEAGLEAGAYLKGDVVLLLKKLAANTENKVDDAMVSMIAGALGR